MGLGCVMGVLASLCLAVNQARFGIYLSALPVCVLGILTPGTLIDLCRMSTMRDSSVKDSMTLKLHSGLTSKKVMQFFSA